MKLLPCHSPQCSGRGAMLPRSAAFPNGEPYLAGRYVSEVCCSRCGRRSKIKPADWAALPELRDADFAALAKAYKTPSISQVHLSDFMGYGLTDGQARDVHDAGYRRVEELEALERKAGE